MKTAAKARELAQAMVELGTDAGVHTVALPTRMSTPLGLTIGYALEVQEALALIFHRG
jgi:thymidine phosphorylase